MTPRLLEKQFWNSCGVVSSWAFVGTWFYIQFQLGSGLLRWLENEDEDGCQRELEDEDKAKHGGCGYDKENKDEDFVDRRMSKCEN